MRVGAVPAAGRVLLIGTPAEEGGNGKELIARDGAFEGLDAAVMAHPFGADVADPTFIGRRIVRIVYHGVAAHAAAAPFQGRNALDAVALNYQAVGLLRQHLVPGDRIHGVVVDGGERPNVVPERAELEYSVRSHSIDTLRELSARVEDIAHGIALATGTGVEVRWDPQPFSLPIRHNGPLAERWAVAQAERGRTVRRAADAPAASAASTDFGNVSVRVPGIHPVVAVAPADVALHTREFAAFAGSPEAVAVVRMPHTGSRRPSPTCSPTPACGRRCDGTSRPRAASSTSPRRSRAPPALRPMTTRRHLPSRPPIRGCALPSMPT